MDWNADEKDLYAKSRALKMQARELRKTRLAREARYKASVEAQRLADQAKRAEEAEKKAAEDEKDLDERIRKSLLAFADKLKFEGLAVKAPDRWALKYLDSMVLIDKKSGKEIQIRTMSNGFNWD